MLAGVGNDSITLDYQPLVTLGGTIAGVEALMRWHHHARGPISPEAFIPIFERSGLILPLSRWALEQACVDAANWSKRLMVAVNLSVIQFEREDLPALVLSALRQSRLAPERLELEVSEATLVSAADVAKTMRRLRAEGVTFVLAGFGVGIATPASLDTFPFSKIKISSRFVVQAETSASARSIIRMIIKLGHSRGVSVAAEGIETLGQLTFLQEEGCDWFQGFLMGRPAPIDQLTDQLVVDDRRYEGVS